MQRSQFRVLKTIGALLAAAAVAPTLAAAQGITIGGTTAVSGTDSVKVVGADTTKAKILSGTAIQLGPQSGAARPGQGIVIQMQGPNGKQMNGTLKLQGTGRMGAGLAPSGGQPQIKTESADTTGKIPPADGTKAPSR